MTQLFLLTEGYAIHGNECWQASSSSVLVDVDGYKLLVDPGANKKAITSSLQKLDIGLDEIDLIFLTHKHLDHIALVCMFENIPLCDGSSLLEGDQMTLCSKHISHTDIEIIHTPGHCSEHYSLLIQTSKWKIAIAGDLFWWQDNQKPKDLINSEDPLAEDMELLKKHRQAICARADLIVPGHGKPFLTTNFLEYKVDMGGIL